MKSSSDMANKNEATDESKIENEIEIEFELKQNRNWNQNVVAANYWSIKIEIDRNW